MRGWKVNSYSKIQDSYNRDEDKEDGYDIGAEHDQFYTYPTDYPLTAEDVQCMVDLGWFQEEVPHEDEFTADLYDPEEGWSAYV